MPEISIVVPCYNQAEWLTETLNSVLLQSYKNWECIIVNDGSSDGTEEIARAWCEKDIRIKYLYKKNGGVGSARNVGIAHAEGEYILPLDGDDLIHKNYVRDALDQFGKSPGLTLVYAEAEFFGTINGEWYLPEYKYKSLLARNMIYCSGIFKKMDWERAGQYDETLKNLEDWDFWIRLLYGDKRVFKIPKVRFYYRQRKNSKLKNGLNDGQRFSRTENQIFLKNIKIYEEYFGSIPVNLFTVEKLTTEISRIKNSLVYKLSYPMVNVLSPFRNRVKKIYASFLIPGVGKKSK